MPQTPQQNPLPGFGHLHMSLKLLRRRTLVLTHLTHLIRTRLMRLTPLVLLPPLTPLTPPMS